MICAVDTSIEDLSRFTITRRDGDVCTTLELGAASDPAHLRPAGPGERECVARAVRRFSRAEVPRSADWGLSRRAPPARGCHFRATTFTSCCSSTTARASRTPCASTRTRSRSRPDARAARARACGATCQLDATYRFTTSGGLAAFRDATVLAPPASYTRLRQPEAVPGTEMSCAPPFPPCGGASVDVADVMAALSIPTSGTRSRARWARRRCPSTAWITAAGMGRPPRSRAMAVAASSSGDRAPTRRPDRARRFRPGCPGCLDAGGARPAADCRPELRLLAALIVRSSKRAGRPSRSSAARRAARAPSPSARRRCGR